MSFIASRVLATAKNISPKIFQPRCGFQRCYWRRRDSFSELSSAMQSFENYMKEFDREMNRVLNDFQKSSPVKLPRILSPFEFGRIREIPLVSINGGNNVYKIQLEMEGMKPEDINITLKNNELTITARRDENRDDGSRFVKEHSYHYSLPDEINPDTIRSSLSEGILTIEAPLPAIEPKEIPVKIESAEKSESNNNDHKK